MLSLVDAQAGLYLVAFVIPDPGPVIPPGLEDFTGLILSWVKGAAIVGGVLGLLICAIMIILGHRNRGQMATDGFVGVSRVAAGLALASAAVAIVGAILPATP